MNNTPPDKSKLDALNTSLYSRTHEPKPLRRVVLHDVNSTIKDDWEHPPEHQEESPELNERYEAPGSSFFNKILIASAVFFVLAVAIGAFMLFRGSNVVSANNVDITVSGPVSVSGGEPFQFDIQVHNKNNIKLEIVDLSLEYPSGTVDPSNTTREMKTFRELLPDIEPGQSQHKTLTAILYGEENVKKDIKIKAEYRVQGSNAIFFKETSYSVFISSSPLTLSVSSFDEIQNNQEIDLTVTLTSNSKYPLKNLLLKGAYPFGFTFISSDVKPTFETSLWEINDLAPGAKRVIKIRGKLQGQDEEDRVFKFSVGVQNPKQDRIMGAEFAVKEQVVRIKKPFVSVNLVLNGNSSSNELVSNFNEPIRGEVIWFNNLPIAINDAEIHLKFSGGAFDKSTVNPEEGFYRSSDNEIVWDKKTVKNLAAVGAGESGRVTFTFIPKDMGSLIGKPLVNPQMNLNVSVKASRLSETNVPETIDSSAVRVVKIAPTVSLVTNLTRSDTPFEQSGPIPPEVEKTTTYTVVWTVYNTSSIISNAKVESFLPPYVKFLGKISPTGSDLKYNPTDGKLVWNVGTVPAYSAANTNKKEVVFQIGFEPSANQEGSSPMIVDDVTLTAVDNFTNIPINVERPKQTPKFQNDSNFSSGDDKVVQ
ncbi:MAG: hypothetical protein V4526_03000 [Patescibacteria group bacterium]